MVSEVSDIWDSEENFTKLFRLFLFPFELLVSVSTGEYWYVKSRLNHLTYTCQ